MSDARLKALREALTEYEVEAWGCRLLRVAKLVRCEPDAVFELRCPCSQALQQSLANDLKRHWQQCGLEAPDQVVFQLRVRAHGQASGKPSLPNVSNVIAVASGKGGVGKSTTSANIACSLAQMGAKVGLLDADVYGPNQPLMMGVDANTAVAPGALQPYLAHGVYTMSMGYLVDEDTPMVWRGPMVSKVVTQLLQQTTWPTLDYLIIDLPPGTGDVQLTVSKIVRLTGALIVTTPQDVALQDAQKAIQMFHKVEVPILGMVENMSVHVCSACGHEEHVFGADGATTLSQQHQVPLLGQLPLSLAIRESADQGTPIACQGDTTIAQRYHAIAQRLAVAVAQQPINYDRHFNVSLETESATPSQGESSHEH